MYPTTLIGSELAQTRSEIDQLKESLRKLEQRRDELQAELISQMKSEGVLGVRTAEYNFTLAKKKDFKVVDEKLVMEDLKKRNEYQNYVYPKIDMVKLKSYQSSLLKGAGEILSGVEPVEIEYMSIRSLTPKNA